MKLIDIKKFSSSKYTPYKKKNCKKKMTNPDAIFESTLKKK